ncbi:hypothetical protein QR685DRAFT_336376 [Neurospora intermedia]|uniref:Uncharacterized protein n=1 Tax=Neurospora intermedia TaxID=5142 RepID=A0ABR3D6H8_NEUIN
MDRAHHNSVSPAVEFGAFAHGPVQIPPDTAARRARLKKALLSFDLHDPRDSPWTPRNTPDLFLSTTRSVLFQFDSPATSQSIRSG